MLAKVLKKPSCFNYLEDNMIYINVISDKNGKILLQIALQVYGKNSSIHIEMKEWGHNVLRQMIKDWEGVKEIARNRGANKMIASFPDVDDKKWQKFIRHFGFPEPTAILMSQQEI